jgi:hypothetical protein
VIKRQRTVQMPEHADRLKLLNIKGLTFDNPDLTEEQFSQLTALLYEYQEIFCADYEQLPMSNLPPYEIQLTSDMPIRQKQYPLTPQKEVVMEKIVDKLLQAKIVQLLSQHIIHQHYSFVKLIVTRTNEMR